MTFSLKKLIGISSSSAEVNDNHLVLSFPDAKEPVIWRMALKDIGTAVFEVKQDKDGEQSKLVLKPKKGTAEIIAAFHTKKEAVDALVMASKALQQGHSQNSAVEQKKVVVQSAKTANDSHETVIINPVRNKSEAHKWLIALLGAGLVIGLYYYLTTLIPVDVNTGNMEASVTSAPTDPSEATGVPVSADAFLGNM